MIRMLGLARDGAPCLDPALLGALHHLQPVLAPEPLHPLVVDDSAAALQQGVGAADAEARVLAFELLALSEQRPLLFWVRDIADRRPRDFQEAAGPPLRQAAFCGVGDVASLLLDGIIGLGYFLGLYWGLEQFLDDVHLQVALGQQAFEAGVFFLHLAQAGGFVGGGAAEARAPAVEAVFGDVVLAADFGDGLLALLGLLQEGDDLLVSELVLLHVSILPFR